MTPEQREEVYATIQAFNTYLPQGPLQHKMRRIRQFEDQTYFAWIGKYGLGDPYYFRIHSPVTFCEFDFHCGSESLPGSHTPTASLLGCLRSRNEPSLNRDSLPHQHVARKVPYPHCQQAAQLRRLRQGSDQAVETGAGREVGGGRLVVASTLSVNVPYNFTLMHRVSVYMSMSRISLCVLMFLAGTHDLDRAATLFSSFSTVVSSTLNLPAFFL
jgi:hypothetical protein